MIRSLAIVASALALLAGCAPGAEAQPPATTPRTAGDLSPGSCAAAGGAIKKVCRRQNERCVIPFKDGGKVCSDKKDCQGLCLSTSNEIAKPGQKITGTCQKNDDPCGCFQIIENGKLADASRCVD